MEENIFNFLECANLPDELFTDELDEGDMWQHIASDIGCNLSINSSLLYDTCMDIDLSIIDEDDYGVDFSDDKRMLRIFFTGDSGYFVGIWLGNDDKEKLDKLPLYLIDMENDIPVRNLNMNFRQYIEKLLTEFIVECETNDPYIRIAKGLLEDVKQFSTDLIDKGEFPIFFSETIYSTAH